MAVPAHDERDYKFAKKYNLEINSIIETNEPLPYVGDGKHINSDIANKLLNNDASEKIFEALSKLRQARKSVNYKLHD